MQRIRATTISSEFNHLYNIGQGVLSDMGAIYTLGVQAGTVIRNNLIHDVNSFTYGGWGIYPDEGSSDMVIENNIVSHRRIVAAASISITARTIWCAITFLRTAASRRSCASGWRIICRSRSTAILFISIRVFCWVRIGPAISTG